jgi:hypothetical protein
VSNFASELIVCVASKKKGMELNCGECGKTFGNKKSLGDHKRQVHGNVNVSL